ncbi:MAG: hypothetical protein J3K34DRAFT_174470 [Monoraphidium minutum]|nr:MAG: hypothetical protein J3K34DRAFT_174470 [Monoraphidium minutum]
MTLSALPLPRLNPINWQHPRATPPAGPCSPQKPAGTHSPLPRHEQPHASRPHHTQNRQIHQHNALHTPPISPAATHTHAPRPTVRTLNAQTHPSPARRRRAPAPRQSPTANLIPPAAARSRARFNPARCLALLHAPNRARWRPCRGQNCNSPTRRRESGGYCTVQGKLWAERCCAAAQGGLRGTQSQSSASRQGQAPLSI